jgi:ParB/Sulfiredoxin domain
MYKPDDFSSLAPLNLNKEAKKALIENKLELEPWTLKKNQEIEIKQIKPPSAFQRLNSDDDFDDLDSIKSLKNFDPIKVAALNDSKHFILVDGYRRFRFQLEKGAAKIECEIMGVAKCRSQVSAARANIMSILSKPLTSLELSYGFYELGNELENEFGESYFFKHGGNRKKNIEDQASIVDYMAKIVSIKLWAVRALHKFAKELGPHALKGLQNRDDFNNLSLRMIHKLNGQITKEDLRKKIDEEVKKLEKDGKDEKDICSEAGEIAFDFIKKKLSMIAKRQKKSGAKKKGTDPGEKEEQQSEGELETEDLNKEAETGKKKKGKLDTDDNKDDENGDGEDSESGDDLDGDESEDNLKETPAEVKDQLIEFIDKLESIKKLIPDEGDLSRAKKSRIKDQWEEVVDIWGDLSISMKHMTE